MGADSRERKLREQTGDGKGHSQTATGPRLALPSLWGVWEGASVSGHASVCLGVYMTAVCVSVKEEAKAQKG